jgi:hypothetical protein
MSHKVFLIAAGVFVGNAASARRSSQPRQLRCVLDIFITRFGRAISSAHNQAGVTPFLSFMVW